MDGIQGVSAAGAPLVKPAEPELRKALADFEAYVAGEMLKRAIPEDEEGLLDGGSAGRMYRDLLMQELARRSARDTGFGLAAQLAPHLEPEASKPSGEETKP
jgi:Rod binding domain-containing protein